MKKLIVLFVFILSLYSINIISHPISREIRTIPSTDCDCSIIYHTTTVENFTFAGDTSEADTSDIVCMNDTLWEYKPVGSILKINNGWNRFIVLDLVYLRNCIEGDYTTFIEILDSSTACWFYDPPVVKYANAFLNDTFFIYYPTDPGIYPEYSDCSFSDSGAIYSDGSYWRGVCDYIYSWEVKEYGGACYTTYDSTFVIFDGDTLFLIDSLIGGY